mmetsp:Transcript_11301/g.10815  ORF Transcript_11301/g.10815 Transcript_11301/m.10815 type:complete len:173 (-) Transcript_11301:622-1140(-)|eukprot:CAMPEP_0197827876 /NCGR_PEP_ID=MMETSP1437-20131217/4563_1 /TAXON_ID=49252 ORGANISM="Eucampia antarctica, Strain CCMP1452" /NCGR_SAMPLE_ID=MMETSP1437 /ASSEMBLY_ACC=CAM_ASM_001096 /LENGTH=172 /DNA_ID=CAMNT_0043428889 /DNA_START=81 /DNA_END=599 /DNA_ORIENTATION=-
MLKDFVSIILVGAVWGCTNPLVRRGSEETKEKKADDDSSKNSNACNDKEDSSFVESTWRSLSRFRRASVWAPYLFNQSGSILYYFLLATSDLTTTVPACNALALVFSSLTSYFLGERLNKPIQGTLGALLVTLGVAICMISSSSSSSGEMKEKEMNTYYSTTPTTVSNDGEL